MSDKVVRVGPEQAHQKPSSAPNDNVTNTERNPQPREIGDGPKIEYGTMGKYFAPATYKVTGSIRTDH